MKSRWFVVLALSGALAACNMHKGKDAKEEGGEEQKIAFEKVPAAAQATIKQEAGDQKVDSVDAEEMDGKTVYEVDVVQNGQNYEVIVGADGKIISKKVDNEADEKPAAGEAGGKKEEKD